MITCVLLTAGQSQRFGSPKALAKIDTKEVITVVQETLMATSIDEIIVVLGAHAEIIKPFLLKHKRVKVVYNKDHILGQTSSFQCGFRNTDPDSKGVFLLPVDFPLIKAETFNSLSGKFSQNSSKIVVPEFDGKKGHPPIFPHRLRDEILSLDTTKGVNSVIHAQHKNVLICPVNDRGVISSFNTSAELQAIIRP